MFKKSLLAVFAIFASSAAFGAPTYNGFIGSAPIGSGVQGEAAVADVIFNCMDADYGKFDLCVDVDFSMARDDATVNMGVNLSSKIMRSHKNVLVRYNFLRNQQVKGGAQNWYVRVLNGRGGDFVMAPVNSNRTTVVSRVSNNGGATWSNLRMVYR